jgi:hypothetical protein
MGAVGIGIDTLTMVLLACAMEIKKLDGGRDRKEKTMKKKHGFLFGIAVLLMAAMFTAAGCDTGTNPDTPLPGGPTIVGERYVGVPLRSDNFGRAAVAASEWDDALVESRYRGDSYYYFYYLGYVQSVPIAYKDNWRYNGITPITFTYDKSWITEETITDSTTKTKENSTTVSVSATVEIEAGWEVGTTSKFVGHVSASATAGKEWGSMVSTSNTYEVAKTKSEGESQGIATTIGEHGEEPGVYRYAYFGVTDAYALYEVNKDTREIIHVAYTTCARPSSMAWGIDFDPDYQDPKFGKTGGGEDLEIPDIDFTNAPVPTEELEEDEVIEPPPPEAPQFINTSMSVDLSSSNAVSKSSSNTKGDGDISSKSGKETKWEFAIDRLTLENKRADETYGALKIECTYTAIEGGSDSTTWETTATFMVYLTDRQVVEVNIEPPQTVDGSVTGQHYDFVNVSFVENDVIKSLAIRYDGSGKDGNSQAFNAVLNLRFEEKNPDYNP